MRLRIPAVLLLCLPAIAASATAQTAAPASQVRIAHPGQMPLHFEPNAGRVMAGTDYLAHTAGYQLGLRSSGVELVPDAHGAQPVRMEFYGATAGAAAVATEQQSSTVSYFFGNDPKKWQTGLPMYGRVSYRQIYPGVDITWYGTDNQIEYDLTLAPNAAAAKVRMDLTGANAKLLPSGDLALDIAGSIVLRRPVAYQEHAGVRTPVAVSYQLAKNSVTFQFGAYDHSAPLVIDPVVSYSSYLGGSFRDMIGQLIGSNQQQDSSSQGLAIDSARNIYVTGTTQSTDFPVKGTLPTPAKADSSYSSAFVSKFNASGSLAYSAYIGGSYDDVGYAIAVDSTGSAYLTGRTTSEDFPITSGAYGTICAPFQENATLIDSECEGGDVSSTFVLKLNAAGNKLTYSTYLGGSQNAYGYAIAVDGSGQAYVAGYFNGDDCYNPSGASHHEICFPTTPGAVIQDNGNNVSNGYLTVFNSSGSGLLYSTLIGDPTATMNVCPAQPCNGTNSLAVAVDPNGNFYVGGYTYSTRLPATKGAYQTTTAAFVGANTRGWLAKFAPVTSTGATLTYLTYLGGSGSDSVGAIAADASGNAYLTSSTSSRDFPVTKGAYQTTCGSAANPQNGCTSAYVAKMNPAGSALIWATYFGDLDPDNVGDQIQFAGPIALDASNNPYITCQASPGLETVDPLSVNQGGNDQACLAEFSADGSKLLFASLFGGGTAGGEYGAGLAVDSSANMYLAGVTDAQDFTATSNAAQPEWAGNYDGFVAVIKPAMASTTALSISPGTSFVVGASATLKATIAGTATSHTGTVTFNALNGNTVYEALGTASVVNGIASLTLSTAGQAAGTYSIDAVYSGDGGNSASKSAAQSVTLTDATSTTKLAASSSSVTPPASETFTATVTGTGGTVTGTVTFSSDGVKIGTATVNDGKAVFTQSSNGVPAATYPVTATYSGNSYYKGSTSAAVNVTVK